MPRILIIRPKFRAKADMQTCTDAGWLAVPFSPIEIEVDEGALRRLPERFKQADAVFWVSPTAIETAAPHLDFSDGLFTSDTRRPQKTDYGRAGQPQNLGGILSSRDLQPVFRQRQRSRFASAAMEGNAERFERFNRPRTRRARFACERIAAERI